MKLPKLTHLQYFVLSQTKNWISGVEIRSRLKEIGYEIDSVSLGQLMRKLIELGLAERRIEENLALKVDYLITNKGLAELEHSVLFYRERE